MNAKSLIPVLLLSLFSAGQAVAHDISAGESVYQKDCKTCHGPTAKGMAVFPKLAGNSADYLVSRLNKYRAGESVGPNTPLMAPIAKKLSDEDIANVAAYIAATFK